MLSQELFRHNRHLLRSSLQGELIILAANGLLQRSGDTVYPFRQDSNFYYLTGIEQPDVLLVINGKSEFLVLPKQSKAEMIFGGVFDLDLLKSQSGIQEILFHTDGVSKIKSLLKTKPTVHTVLAPPLKVIHSDSFFTNAARRQFVTQLKRWQPGVTLKDVRKILTKMRQIKQPEEIEAIKKAIECTGSGFDVLRRISKSGIYEYEVQAILDQQFRSQNMVHGYAPIVAGGKNACVLHYINNNQKLSRSHLLLVDAGAEYRNYSADITRTYHVDESYQNQRQQDVIEAVERIHKSVIAEVKSGMTWKAYDKLAKDLMIQELSTLGIVRGDVDKAVRTYFPHSIGHSLGLDVHDVCEYTELQENMVITCEPGIYIPEEGIGVRIEDDILITKDSATNLSEHIPYK